VADILVVGPGGKVVPVPTEHAAQYAAVGYPAANERQIADYKRDQEFSTPGQQLVTGLEAAGSTATFGLSTHLEKALGVNPEDIATRERVNPIAHGLGTAAGFVVPGLIPGIGELTAPGLISRAGRGVAARVGAALPEATGLLGRAAARAAELGSGSAIEGGLWATGQVVHEKALNPQLSAENALHTIGLGVVLGGSLGGALGTATEAVPAAISKAKGIIFGAEKEPGVYAKLAGKFYKEEPQTIQDIIYSKGQTLSNPKVRAEFSKKLAEGLEDRINADNSALDVYEKHIQPTVAEDLHNAVLTNAESHAAKVEDLLEQFGTKGKLDSRKIDTFLKDTVAEGRPIDTELFDSWHQSSQDLHSQIEAAHKYVPTGEYNPDAVKSVASKTADLVEDARKQASLAQAVERIGSGGEGGIGSLAESLGGSMALGHVIPGIGHLVGATLGPVHSAGKLLNPTRAAEVLGWFERANTAAEKALGRSVSDLVKPVGEAVERRVGKTAAQIANKFDKETPPLRMLAGDPEELMNRMSRATEHFSEHAPTIAQNLQITTGNALSFVASKIPPSIKDGPLGHEILPTHAAMLKFNRYHDAVNDPLSVIKNPTPEGLETLQTVYPQYLQQARTALLEKITNTRQPIPYQSRMRISDLLGQPADWSMSQPGIQAIQTSLAATKMPPATPPMGGTPKGGSKAKAVKHSQHSMTPQQASLQSDRK